MEARQWRAAVGAVLVVLAVRSTDAASYRTQNFLVTASTPELAREVGDTAEQLRRELSKSWLGRELPDWQDKCPITVHASPNLLAGGVTQFYFDHGRPNQWTMSVQGTRERVLDSVLPHEILHTIFATHFGGPLPRWADEGACTTVEDISERSKQERLLIRFLTNDQGIPFNRMFAMREYPKDILPLYAQGYSLARFLIAIGGRQRFVAFVGEGLRGNNWTAAVRSHYGCGSLSELQVQWLGWVRQGSQEANARVFLVNAPARNPAGASPRPADVADAGNPAATAAPLPPPPGLQAATTPRTDALVPVPDSVPGESWYKQQRDKHRESHPEQFAVPRPTGDRKSTVVPSGPPGTSGRSVGRPQPPASVQQMIIETSRLPNPTWR